MTSRKEHPEQQNITARLVGAADQYCIVTREKTPGLLMNQTRGPYIHINDARRTYLPLSTGGGGGSVLLLSGLLSLGLGSGLLGLLVDGGRLGAVSVLRVGLDGLLLLGLGDRDKVGHGLAGTGLTGRVVGLHAGGGKAQDRQQWLDMTLCFGGDSHLDLDSQDSLPQQDVPDGLVNEVPGGLTGVDHVSIGELHGLGSGSTQLSGDDDLATLGTGLHDESEDTVACTENGTTDQFSASNSEMGCP